MKNEVNLDSMALIDLGGPLVIAGGNQINDEQAVIQKNLREYFADIFAKLPRNTRKAYTSDLTQYFTFCQQQSPVYDPLTPDFEQQKDQLKRYVEHLFASTKKRAVITRHLSSISSLLGIAEIKNPLKVSGLMTGFIKVTLGQSDDRGNLIKPAKQKQALALDGDLLARVNIVFEVKTLQDKRDIALLNFCSNTLLRGSEIAQIEVADLQPAMEQCFVKRTKTDKTGQGTYRHVSRETYALIDDWLTAAGISEGPVFRRLSNRGGKVQANGISYKTVNRIYKAVLNRCDVIDAADYTAHSCRVGGAVDMRRAGLTDSDIMDSGGWQSLVFYRYTAQTELRHSGAAKLTAQRRQAINALNRDET